MSLETERAAAVNELSEIDDSGNCPLVGHL